MRRPLVSGLATAGAVAVLARLSAWQWDRGRLRGSLLNYSYAVEWGLLAVVLVAVVVVRARRVTSGEDDDASRDVDGRVIGPPLRPGEELGDVTRVRLRRWASRRGR
jgi:hypothetical protein